MRGSKSFVAALVVVTVVVIASCSLWSAAGSDGTVKRIALRDVAPVEGRISMVLNPDQFVFAGIGEPNNLDPAVDYETAGGEVLQNVYETLVWYDRDSVTTLVPLLATEVPTVANGGISPDWLNYTFDIKSGIKFHDNTTVMDVDDVVYSVKRVLRIHDPDGPSWMLEEVMTDYLSYYVGEILWEYSNQSTGASWVLNAIGGTDPFYVITEQDVTNVSNAVVLKVDGDTVQFRLTHPFPAFLQICAYTVMDIVSMDYVEAHGGIVNDEHNTWMDEHAYGTGPYKFVDWEVGSKIHLQRFDGYHGARPALKDVYLVKANDVNTRILMLQAGDADSIFLPIEYESIFAGKADYRIVKGLPTFNMMFAGFNMNINETAAAVFGSDVPWDFFQDKHVRMAFASLINYTQFITNVLKGNAIHPNGPIPKGMFGYNASIPEYVQDLAKAEAEFKLAMSPDDVTSWWDAGFKVALMYNAGNVYRETACQYMKTALETLNSKFEATVNPLDWPTYLANLRKSPSPFPMFWLGWAPDYADPADYVTPFLHSVVGIFPYSTGYANASIDDLIDLANGELNETKRYDLYSQLSMLCYEDVPYIWLYQGYNFHIERSWVRGYYFNPMYSGLYYAAMWKEDTNIPPTAYFTVTPPNGDTMTLFSFDASGSSDAEDATGLLEVRWDWENDSSWDTSWSTVKVLDHQFTTAGTYTVKLEVRDTGGLNDTATMDVEVLEWIPEFSGVIVPIVAMLAVVLAVRRRRLRPL